MAPSVEDYEGAQTRRELVILGALALAVAGIAFALTSLAQAKTVVVVDRGAWDVGFGERPTLVERDGAYFIHAGALAPVAIAKRSAPHEPIARLRAALEGLLTTE